MLFNTTRRPPDPKHEAHNHMDGDVSTDGAVYENLKSQNQSQSMVDMRMLGSHSMCAVLSAARGSEGLPCAQPVRLLHHIFANFAYGAPPLMLYVVDM
jgi:hypothetical protein